MPLMVGFPESFPLCLETSISTMMTKQWKLLTICLWCFVFTCLSYGSKPNGLISGTLSKIMTLNNKISTKIPKGIKMRLKLFNATLILWLKEVMTRRIKVCLKVLDKTTNCWNQRTQIQNKLMNFWKLELTLLVKPEMSWTFSYQLWRFGSLESCLASNATFTTQN